MVNQKSLCIVVFLFWIPFITFSEEYKNLRDYEKLTHKKILSASDWLTYDRKHKTIVWQHANHYNLINKKPNEYKTLKQRRDFYAWLYEVLKKKGNEVVWPKMASFISNKLQLIQQFPQCLFIRKNVKYYAKIGSEKVFVNAFDDMYYLYNLSIGIKNNEAKEWDNTMLYKEQFNYLQSIYDKMNTKSLGQIERIAKGKFLYAFFIPKEIRFKGHINNPQDRFNFAVNQLKQYCENLKQ
jgi:hypothetical protein